MKLDNSNKRISNIIAGILIVFVSLIFIAIALGVSGDHLYIQDDRDIGHHDCVPVAQNCDDVAYYHIQPGSIHEIQEGYMEIDDEDEYVFPLCIDPCDTTSTIDELLNNWYVVYEVYGGYSPSDRPGALHRFNLYQQNKKTGVWEIIGTDGYEIGWSLDWIQIEDETVTSFDPDGDGPHEGFDILFTFETDCCYSYWVAIIDTSCNNKACIESDQYPSVDPDCSACSLVSHIPGKYLELRLRSTWCGCECDRSQEFMLILVQIFRIPNSRIKFIAS